MIVLEDFTKNADGTYRQILSMKKEDSIALKGVAIFMMLLYHLFY